MNLHDQLGALESSLDALLRAATVPAPIGVAGEPIAEPPAPLPSRADDSHETALTAPAPVEPEHDTPPTLMVSRPDRDTIQMTIAGKSVLLNPEGVSELIEELSNVRASMSVEQPMGVAPGWRFAATKNPVMAVQKHANGDRLLLMRHTGHGWVPFTFSPDMVVELYAMLTRR
ncbi:hypothetical protein P9239_03680 [Caballeronia sp. LZ062]|uniref:hypothetical protein n=1 Tax=unclassified Caballeronia TaxID=2646786 RepID=UPI0028616C16|nr:MULTISPECIES: hypothetical protein [unclassified Caballeronia]MDR5857149.1 hypothetical protein [Caballeronia sp. LZ050]MDR5869455.1 hypothetical protein [Caballeronia sp. LZ062]